MEVLSVTLKNFKAHRDRYYEFSPGTNAICGENGAGKTSILEAIAWVLFDHCEYTKPELINVGAKSAQVTVTFVSSQDGRVYEVRRCTNRGYELHDPQLNLNLGLKKIEDVKQWLCDHLGVSASTELAKLFAETIGIPQGTFTVDFLKRPADRKKVFDPILKVEEYKQAYERTRDLETYARSQVQQLERQIADYDQHLADWPHLKQQAADLAQTIAQDQTQIEQLAQQTQQLQEELEQLTAQAQRLQALETQVQQCQTQLASKQETRQLLEQSWISAQQAVHLCRQHRSSFQAYQQAQETLQSLAQQQRQRQQLSQQREQIQTQLSDRQVEQSQLQGRLESFTQMRQALAQWQQLVTQQENLEQQQAEIQQALQSLESQKLQVQTLQTQRAQRQTILQDLAAAIAQLQTLETQVQQLPQLETQRQDLQQHLSRVEAAKQFAAELQQLVTQVDPDRNRYRQQVRTAMTLLQKLPVPQPDLTRIAQALDAGITLNDHIVSLLEQLLADLTEPAALAKQQTQLQQLQDQIKTAQAAQAQWSTLTVKQQQQTQLQQEIADLQAQCDRIQAQLDQEPQLQAQQVQLAAKLAQLQDPKGQIRVLQQHLQQDSQIQTKIAQVQQDCRALQQTLLELNQKLQEFVDLETQVEQQQQIQQTQQATYQIYLRHRNEANTFKQLDQQRQSTETELQGLEQQLAEIKHQWQQQSQQHDPQRLAQVSATYQTIKSQQDQLQGGLPPKRQQLQSLEQQLQVRQSMAEQRDRDRAILTQKQQVQQFVTDARRVYNQSGPRITKFYLTEISWEADRLFRELLNRNDVALEWTEDYEIRVQGEGHWRSFKSLSGGEQMCAALAVRLALLKVLADINVAFFDEPTTNMDQLRRRQLAEALGHLKTFRQLFVISHDDTFESVTENVIRVEREDISV